MPKAEKGSIKWLANKMKAKGLQKLRWYCEMCQKQCRDQNGFKCHIASESHQRQLLVVAETPESFLSEFSREFEKNFLLQLKCCHGTKRVHANLVYQEYISDRNHVHMNATSWTTLTGFVKYLGRTGKCIVDQTEKGWFITYIERDPDEIKRQEELAKKRKLDRDDEERMHDFIEKQAKRALESAGESGSAQLAAPTELQRDVENGEKIAFSITGPSSSTEGCVNGDEKSGLKPLVPLPKKNALKEAEKAKAVTSSVDDSKARKSHWLKKNIVVKIVTKKHGSDLYKSKGVVTGLQDKFTAELKISGRKESLICHQSELETVIPSPGRPVLIVNGPYRGLKAEMIELLTEEFKVSVRITDEGSICGKIVKLLYEDICKLNV